ncbi:MAG: histidine--tRNA ligase [Candidatus Dependentiae bacterium]|nr:histidine--tRNA ligase [Candidatus Dependentiae bacterium]
MFLKVKGVCDNFFEMTYWSGVRKKIEAHLKSYNFGEIDTPILEHVSLFQRGLGYETDVVSKQMFIIESKGSSRDDDQICLRPEGTAGTMRAFLDEQSQAVTPCKVFSYGPMFRYERPQKGRMREFHQINLEMIGGASILYDAHLIKMLQTLFAEVLQIESFVLKLNFLGQPADRKEFVTALVAFLTPQVASLCADCQTRLQSNPLRVLDCKSVSCQKLFESAPKLSDFFSQQTQAQWQLLQETLHELSVTYVIDPHLVRGLDYYNKTVFEFVSVNLGAQSAFCAGGRYDGLAQQLGSKVEVPAFGSAIGMERLLMILESQKERLSEKPQPLTCIIPLTEAQNKLALHLADFLQSHAKAVDLLLDDQKTQNKMKKANQLKAQFVLILGEDEQKNNTVTVKNMITGSQEVVLQSEVHMKV